MTDATPLPERIESTTRHDPYINGHFLSMFDHEDNADLARMFTVGLAVNDPERKEAGPSGLAPVFREPEEGGGVAVEEYAPSPDDQIVYTDKDGDVFHGLYYEHECENHGTEAAVVVSVNEVAAIIPMPALDELIRWLQSRRRKGKRAEGGRA